MRHLKRSGGSHTAGTLLLQTREGNSDPNDVKLMDGTGTGTGRCVDSMCLGRLLAGLMTARSGALGQCPPRSFP
jgi:hypothetical protein